jgi:hypothetical protein
MLLYKSQKIVLLLLILIVKICSYDIDKYLNHVGDAILALQPNPSKPNEVLLNVNIPDNGKFLPNKNMLPVGIIWTEVLAFIKVTKDPEIPRKVLGMRYMSLFTFFDLIFTSVKYEKVLVGKSAILSGNYNQFKFCNFQILGKSDVCFSFLSFGSGTYTSDIDISVDVNNGAQDLPILTRLRYVSDLIAYFNSQAVTIFGQTTLEAFDINLYFDFGADGIPNLINTLETNDFDAFAIFNRLSVAMLIYADSILLHTRSIVAIDQQARMVLKDLIDACRAPTWYLLEDAGGKALRKSEKRLDPYLKPRSSDFQKRNELTTYHITQGTVAGGENLTKLCHLTAANYFALEAYVPAGSIFYIKLFQTGGPINYVDENAATTSNPNVVKIYKNFVTDYLLMNFAYTVEYFYHYGNSKQNLVTGAKKFWKYAARVVQAVPLLAVNKLKQCWIDEFEASFFGKGQFPPINNNDDVKNLANKWTPVGEQKPEVIQAFISSVYLKCVEKTILLVYRRTQDTSKALVFKI